MHHENESMICNVAEDKHTEKAKTTSYNRVGACAVVICKVCSETVGVAVAEERGEFGNPEEG
jgi:hypothetical protein